MLRIIQFEKERHLSDLQRLIFAHQAFVRSIEPNVSLSIAHNFNLSDYLKSFFKSSTQNCIFVASEDEQICGYFSIYASECKNTAVYRYHTYAVLHEIFVSDDFRSRGIGKEFISSAKQWAKEHRCEYLSVGFSIMNPKAEKFYRANGFRQNGVLSLLTIN